MKKRIAAALALLLLASSVAACKGKPSGTDESGTGGGDDTVFAPATGTGEAAATSSAATDPDGASETLPETDTRAGEETGTASAPAETDTETEPAHIRVPEGEPADLTPILRGESAGYDMQYNFAGASLNALRADASLRFSQSGDMTAGEQGLTVPADRWAAVGATLTGEKFYLAAAADWLNAASYGSAVKQADDAYKVLVGGHYNFDAFKLYGSAQYMKNIAYIGGYSTKEFAPLAKDQDKSTQKGFEAWAVATGVDFNAAGGTVKFSVGYGQGEDQNLKSNNKMKRANVGLGYVYPFSKRTSVYGITGAFWQDADWQQDDITAHEVIIGLMHRW